MRITVWVLATLSLAGSALAQGVDAGRAGVARSAGGRAPDSVAWTPLGLSAPVSDRQRALAPIASLVLPGSGQWLLRQDRFLGYVAVEALAWWKYTTDVHERAAQVEQYKDIARRVARAQFSAAPRDTAWVYYEWMRDYLESGQYSLSATGPVSPETDPTTFNGSRWVLAQSSHALYADQLAEYERTAVKPEFRWSWRNAQFQYDVYRRYTDKRNDANRAAVADLLVIGANHVLSMVDAFATMRLQVRAEAGGRTSVGAMIQW